MFVEDAGNGPRTIECKRRRAVTREALQRAIYSCCLGMSRAEAREMVDSMLDEILKTLVQGEAVKLHGFGKLRVQKKRARAGRNPRTGAPATITARRVVIFVPSSCLVATINGAARVGADDGLVNLRQDV